VFSKSVGRSVVNLCCSCGVDFASVAAFDRHRVGRHAFTFSEGLRLSPSRVDGRRCRDAGEMAAAGMKADRRFRWSIVADAGRFERLRRAA
jgi:hypothetical protein